MFPCLMHHKFLVGGEEGGAILTNSMIYGSFNMSASSSQNLDSFLLFRQNQRLFWEFWNLQKLIWNASLEYELVKKFGVENAQSLGDKLIGEARKHTFFKYLYRVAGIRPKSAEQLWEKGLTSVELVRNAPEEILLSISGIGKKSLNKIRSLGLS